MSVGPAGRFVRVGMAPFLMSASLLAHAGDLDLRGALAAESRGFWEEAQFSGQRAVDVSLVARPEFHLTTADGQQRLVFSPFFRLDSVDRERTHGDVRELGWSWASESWELRLGVHRVFWGVAESNHLVDIINQTDLVENPDGEDKLGQPMANLSLVRHWGTVDLFVLPWFRERTFPGARGRLRSNPPLEVEEAIYESDAKEHHVDFAIRYALSVGGVDFGLYQFRGTNRTPGLEVRIRQDGTLALIPHYEQIDQTGTDVLYAWESWLFKLEALYQSGAGEAYAAAVGGFEYTLTGVAGSEMDLGLLSELHFDSRGDAALTQFNHDVFAGFRLAANDTAGTQALAGVVADVETGALLYNLEVERRLNERWKLNLELRAFASRGRFDLFSVMDRDDYLSLEIARYF